MPTRRKALGGVAAVIALLGGRMLYGDESGSDGAPASGDSGDDDDGPDQQPESDPERNPDSELDSKSGSESDSNEEKAQFEATVTVHDDYLVGEQVAFDIDVNNVGDVPGEYGVTFELDRIDPDTDFGSDTWEWAGALEPGGNETHVAGHTYRATGTYELRLNGEVVDTIDVSSGGGSDYSDTSDDENAPDETPVVTIGGEATLNATEESTAQYDSD